MRFIPDNLPQKGWSLHSRGYLIYTSRKRNANIVRGAYAHRAVIQALLQKSIPPGMHVAHQTPDKENCCPMHNLYLCEPAFNPLPVQPRDGHGRYVMSEAKKRMMKRAFDLIREMGLTGKHEASLH